MIHKLNLGADKKPFATSLFLLLHIMKDQVSRSLSNNNSNELNTILRNYFEFFAMLKVSSSWSHLISEVPLAVVKHFVSSVISKKSTEYIYITMKKPFFLSFFLLLFVILFYFYFYDLFL